MYARGNLSIQIVVVGWALLGSTRVSSAPVSDCCIALQPLCRTEVKHDAGHFEVRMQAGVPEHVARRVIIELMGCRL